MVEVGGACIDSPREPLLALRTEVGKAVVGQDAVVTGLVIALLCRGHVLLEGVPGVAKTLLVRALAAALDVGSARAVHPRPDARRRHRLAGLRRAHRRVLVPPGPGVHQPAARRRDQPHAAEDAGRRCSRRWRSARSPSTGQPRPLPDPFLVAATQNPIEYEGTYPLPEAQLDRFLLKLTVPLPERDEEIAGAAAPPRRLRPARPRRRRACARSPAPPTWPRPRAAVAHGDASAPEVLGYIVDLVRATRTSPVAAAGRLAPRRDRAARDGAGVGVAVRPRLRHPRRRQGAGPAGAAPPGRAAPRGRARGRHAPTPSSTGILATVPAPALTALRPAWSSPDARRCSRCCSTRCPSRSSRARCAVVLAVDVGAAARCCAVDACAAPGSPARAARSRAQRRPRATRLGEAGDGRR